MLPDVVPMFEPGIAAHRRHRPSSALCLDGPGTARPSAACHANSWLSGQNLTDGWADHGKTGAVRSEVLMQPAPEPEQLTASSFKADYSEFTMRGKCKRLPNIRANVRLPKVRYPTLLKICSLLLPSRTLQVNDLMRDLL